MTNRRKERMMSSHHGPYGLGYTRATMGSTKGRNTARWSKSQKTFRSPDWPRPCNQSAAGPPLQAMDPSNHPKLCDPV